jgi:hypothetical protein
LAARSEQIAPAAPLCFSPTRSRIELAASPFHTIALLLSLCADNGAGAEPGRKNKQLWMNLIE